MKQTKRLLAVILSLGLLIGLMPMTATAEEGYGLWVSGREVTAANAADVFENGTAIYDPVSHILTLNNFEYWSGGYKGAAIYYNGEAPLTLNLLGNNTAGCNDQDEDGDSFGVYAESALTVVGTGSLRAYSAKAEDYTVGVYCEGDLTLVSGRLMGCSGDGYRCRGVLCGGNLQVQGGELIGEGGKGGYYSYGVDAAKDLSVAKGARVEGTAEGATKSSCGVCASGTLTTAGVVEGTAGPSETTSTFGVMGTVSVSVTGGLVVATAGKAVSSSLALYCPDGNITISGGAVSAVADTADVSCGMYAYSGALTISGGSVEAFGASRGVIPAPTVNTSASWAPRLWEGDSRTATTGEGVTPGQSNWKSKYVKLSDNTTYPLWVGGRQVTAGNAADVFQDGTVHYNAATNTLFLNEYSYVGSGYQNAALRYMGQSGLFTVNVQGENQLRLNLEGTSYSYGLYAIGGDVALTGDGDLTVAGNVAENNSYGLFTNGSLTLNGPYVTAEAGESEKEDSRGVHVGGDLTLLNGGLAAEGGYAAADSFGLYVVGDLTLSEDWTEATGGDCEGSSFGVCVGGNATLSGGSHQAFAGESADSVGFFTGGDLEITGGVVDAFGADGAFNTRPELAAVADKVCRVWCGEDGDVVDGEFRRPEDLDHTAPFVRVAYRPRPILWVGGREVTVDNEADVFQNGTVSYDTTTNILTLKNYNYTGEGYQGAAIYYEGVEVLFVQLEGTNAVTATGERMAVAYGVYAEGGVIFTGGGTLTATAGKADYQSMGVGVVGPVIIQNSTVTAIAEAAEYSAGVAIEFGILALFGSTLTATAEAAEDTSMGVYATDGITAMASTLTATAGKSEGGSYGVWTNENLVMAGGSLTATGNSAGFGLGVFVEEDFTLLAGQVKASGGDYGVYMNGTLYQRGGSLLAIGSESVSDSLGVYGKMELSGGTLIAQGAQYAFAEKPQIIPSEEWAPLVWSGESAAATGEAVQPEQADFWANYVKISDKATYTLSFDAGLGTGEMADVTDVSGDYTLPECGFTPPAGGRFVGWEVDGVVYQPGATISVYTDLTITAVWEEETGLLGDVDEDGSITSTDARLTLQFYAGKIGEEDLDISVADVDGDGSITSTDARLILQKYAGKIDKFPAE